MLRVQAQRSAADAECRLCAQILSDKEEWGNQVQHAWPDAKTAQPLHCRHPFSINDIVMRLPSVATHTLQTDAVSTGGKLDLHNPALAVEN